MTPDKVPCPVEGCDMTFNDEAQAAFHMKEYHSDTFAPPTPDKPDEGDKFLGMLPPGMLEVLDKRMDDRIKIAIAEVKPEVVEAVKAALGEMLRGAGPGAAPSVAPGGGAITGSPVTSNGAALINALLRSGGGGDTESLDGFIRQASKYKAIGELFNPPASLTERIMQTAYVRSLKKLGLVTDNQMKKLDKELLGGVE